MRYEYQKDLKPIIDGEIELPNFVPMDTKIVLSNIASGGHSMESRWGYAQVDGRKKWAQFFLKGAGMGRPPQTYGGNGYVIIYPGVIGTFAICEHEFESGSGANSNRGWHPGACKKCGIDMSVDSSG